MRRLENVQVNGGYSTDWSVRPLAGAVGADLPRNIARKQGRNARRGDVATAGFDQGSNDIPNHVLEESAAADGVEQSVSRTHQIRAEDPAHAGFLALVTVVSGSERR